MITLIMLSIITFLAVAFLALSNRNRQAGVVAASQTDSRLAAQTAEARAETMIVARMMGSNSIYSYDLLVSRNYINPLGYNPTAPGGPPNLTNVSYTDAAGNPLNNDDQVQNIANLFYDPRPPVYVNTNTLTKAVSNDFRYYLDFNRNGVYDTNGLLAVISPTGGYYDTNGIEIPAISPGNTLSNDFTGDPEWIGVLEHPEAPHSPTNRFVYRYAYLVLPAGKTLDLNYIHNHAKPRTPLSEAFWRNQGFGSWEINLAAFFRDLNTNIWTNAVYVLPPAANSIGFAYTKDALGVINYRYDGNSANLKSVDNLFGSSNAIAFANDLIDGYANGPFLTSSNLTTDDDNTALPWPGSPNPTKFVDVQELFDGTKVQPALAGRLQNTRTNISSYDRYTFYRLLQQLGTDSAPELRGKVNINYTNDITQNRTAPNWSSWTNALQFFTNAAQRLIETQLDKRNPTNWIFDGFFVGTNFAITNIQLFPTNYYTPALHRLLQVAANIYDATTNETSFPSIFRPIFERTSTNIYIAGFTNGSDPNINLLTPNFFKNTNLWKSLNQLALGRYTDNVYGQPVVVGVKKKLPSFHKFVVQTHVRAERKLQFRRPNTNSPPNETNQMIAIGITNVFGFSAWNSYTNAYTNRAANLLLTAEIECEMILTNETGAIVWPYPTNRPFKTNFTFAPPATNRWPGTNYVPFLTNVLFLTNSIYTNGNPHFRILTDNPVFERNVGYPDTKLVLLATNSVRYFLNDGTNTIDFVNLGNLTTHMDIMTNLVGELSGFPAAEASGDGSYWITNRVGGSTSPLVPTKGVLNQILTNMTSTTLLTKAERDGFNKFLSKTNTSELIHNAPFAPVRVFYDTKTFEINDPLVHYMTTDLIDPTATNKIQYRTVPEIVLNNSFRYNPWRGKGGDSDRPQDFDISLKDPLIWNSDSWQFPTNKFPNIGWLGRVHRGTPWQTIYLKSAVAETNAWRKWAGSSGTHPTNDWRFLEAFTVAPNDNAARGLLSVNQTNLAAWSAGLGAVLVLSNSLPSGGLSRFTDPQFTAPDIKPASIELTAIVNEINAIRARKPNHQFQSIGEILEATNLTVNSPFLNTANSDQTKYAITDAAYERIPQQIFSLLKVGEPRFVIYAFGQSLKPAENSIVLNPPGGNDALFNLCTNDQITGEVVTRTVLRVEGTPGKPKTVIENYSILPGD
ncbi:MAG: hypothetical protein ACR2H1_01870 [Limisphaerales bacterium]